MPFADAMGFGSLAEGKGANFAGNIAKAMLFFTNANGEMCGMRVQYNPASVTIQANAQPIPVKYLQANVDASVPTQRTRNASAVLSVQLVFDDTNVKDAFMADKGNITNIGDITSVGTGIAKNVRGTGYSVLPQTNALVAAILRKQTRQVVFKWANTSFSGELTEAQASYNMFNVAGHPIRSTVTINITQEFKDLTKDAWDKSFDSVFGARETGKDAAGASASRRTQNLLNFNL